MNFPENINAASRTSVHGKLRVRPLAACLILPLAIADLGCGSALAATLSVTNCNDAGSGSLRAALALAHDGDSIDLTTLTCGTISLATGALSVPIDNLTLKGPGANALTIAGNPSEHNQYSVLDHSGRGTLAMEGLRIADRYRASVFAAKACVVSSGTVYLSRSIVTDCHGPAVTADGFTSRYSTISYSYKGVVAREGNVSIVSSTINGNYSFGSCTALRIGPSGRTPLATTLIANSTISGNSSYYQGAHSAGCIYEPVTISNSTFAFNTEYVSDPGLYIAAPTVSIESSVFSNNFPFGWLDLSIRSGAHVSGHNNLVRFLTNPNGGLVGTLASDPLLLPLADNGGPTRTHALGLGSPAIDAGSNPAGFVNDQRGPPFARIVGAAPDIGAFEFHPPTIDSSFTGSWFDPTQSGHGLMLEVLPENRLLALWFAFNPQGTEQSWFGGVGTYSGDTAVITDVALPIGGSWIPNFDPNKIVRKPWGTLSFKFIDHDHGKVSFDSVLGYGSGSMDLLRLTNVANQTALRPIGSPGAVTTDTSGNVYFSSSPNLIFKLDPQGMLKRIAGSGAAGYSGDGGPATQAQLNFPLSYPELAADPINYSPLVGGLAVDAGGRVYVADAYNNRIRRIDTNGIIDTVVGTGAAGYSGDGGLAANAQIHWPQGVAVDLSDTLYFSTAFASLRKVTPAGIVSTLAGDKCGANYLGPGLCVPEQIAVDASSNIFVPDGYCRVREVRHDGSIFTVAGADNVPSNGSAFTCGYSGDGGPATKAALNSPYSVAVDKGNNLFIADSSNNCIRKVNAAGIIATVAGVCDPNSLQAGYSGDGGPATSARLNLPYGVAVDGPGNLYIADTNNGRIRKVSGNGTITTIAGNGTQLPAPSAKPFLTPTGSLNTARASHTATLLQNGKVLVAGGTGSGGALLASAELYDPSTNTWSVTGQLNKPRHGHTATRLPDGKVLVVAGSNGDTSAELYDPGTGAWTLTGNLNTARANEHTATLLANGKVLVVGGTKNISNVWDVELIASAELYDPATGTWVATGNLNAGRAQHTATLLPSGKVLVAGGLTGPYDPDFEFPQPSGAELYDPAVGVWSILGADQILYDHTATLLPNGQVLIVAGYAASPFGHGGTVVDLRKVQLFDPGSGTFTRAADLIEAHSGHTATLLPGGKVMIAGTAYNAYPSPPGFTPHSTELYDPAAGAWSQTADLITTRSAHTATLLSDNRVLIAGGSDVNGEPLASAEVYYDGGSPIVTIDASFTGSWFDPAQSGHGLMLEVLPDNRLLALWFAFNPQGNQQSWFGGVGTYSGNTATITDVALPTGGSWIPNFDPAKIVRNPWGTLKFTFADCDHGRVDFVSTDGYGSGSMNLLRLTMPAGLSCP